jgi:hypothetical protein
MFKLNESVYDEVVNQLEVNLKKCASDNATSNEKKIVEALDLLNASAEILEQFGLMKEAEAISKLIVVAAKKKKAPKKSKKDPHTDGLTSEQMLHNLATKGIEFNADDENMAKDHDEEKYYTLWEEDEDGDGVDRLEYDLFKAKSLHEAKEIAQKETNRNKAPLTLTPGKIRFVPKNHEDKNEAKDQKLKYFPEEMQGIPVIYLEKGDQDYNAYCPKCAEQLQKAGKNIHGHLYEEGPNRECKMCGKELESAMGQDAYYKENADPEDNIKSMEHPDEYKHEELENGMDEHDDYEKIMDELEEDEHDSEDQVFI